MYNDKIDPELGPDLPDLGPMPGSSSSSGSSWTHRIFGKAETIIPIILIILFLLFFSIIFLNVDPNSIPLIGGALGSLFPGTYKTNILLIGEPSDTTLTMFERPDFIAYYQKREMDAENLTVSPINTLKNYQIVILDQTESISKTIPHQLAEALKQYVKSGGSLIIVADSGYRMTRTPDIFGWKAVLGSELAPVDCQTGFSNNLPACEVQEPILGKLVNSNPSNKIFEGIIQVPATPSDGEAIRLTVYNVIPESGSTDWFYVQDHITKKTYSGITFKRVGFLGGKVVYFNYNEIGDTPGLVNKVLQFMK